MFLNRFQQQSALFVRRTFFTCLGVPRSTLHQGLLSLFVWVQEPPLHWEFLLPSTPLEDTPPYPVDDWRVGLPRATFPWKQKWDSAYLKHLNIKSIILSTNTNSYQYDVKRKEDKEDKIKRNQPKLSLFDSINLSSNSWPINLCVIRNEMIWMRLPPVIRIRILQ